MESLRIRKLADKTVGERVRGILVPASALKIDQETGMVFVDPSLGRSVLFNPATPDIEEENWPFVGVEFANTDGSTAEAAPSPIRVSTSYISQARREGWAELVGETVVHRPGGPEEDPWRPGTAHTFQQAKQIILHTVNGDAVYNVVGQPDKHPKKKVDDPAYPDGLGFGGEVKNYYDLELVSYGEAKK